MIFFFDINDESNVVIGIIQNWLFCESNINWFDRDDADCFAGI